MHSPQPFLMRSAAAACFALFAASSLFAQAQQKFDKVAIKTPDGVELSGYWYSSLPKAPVVLLLHDVTSDSQRREWNALAEKLQANGYAVLAFDFRGHGQSTSVNKRFFQAYPANRAIPVQQGGLISYKTFQRSYLPVFVNDIAAAKAFLDEKNDAGHCNTNNLILIGAGQGATLGALWLKSEWYRYKWIPPQLMLGIPGRLEKSPAGEKVAAAIWLSYSHRLGAGGSLKQAALLMKKATRDNSTPTVFVYNEKIKNDKIIAKYCSKNLKDKKNPKHQFTGAMGVSNAGQLQGRELLQPGFKVPDEIVRYLKRLKDNARFRNWTPQDFQRTQYFWYMGPGQLRMASQAGDDSFRFADFLSFLPLR